jgi:hypothetical protein
MSTDISPQEQWRDACETFVGFNRYKNYKNNKAFRHVVQVAFEVQHAEPEAKLFVGIVGHIKKISNASAALLKEANRVENNGFLWYITALFMSSKNLMQRAIAFQYPYSYVFGRTNNGETDMTLVWRGYGAGCRRAYLRVADSFLENGNRVEYIRNVLKSARAGCVDAMIRLIDDRVFLPPSDIERWKWICKIVFKGDLNIFQYFLNMFYSEERQEHQHPVNLTFYYLMGKCIYHTYYDICFTENIPRDRLRDFYLQQVKAARTAVNAASACFLRMGVYKDLRVLLCQWVWAGRDEANYDAIS